MDLGKLVEGVEPTDMIFWRDSYIRSFKASAVKVGREKRRVYVVLDRTSFHPRMGGQPSDRGFLYSEDFKIEVRRAIYISGVVVHCGRMVYGEPPQENTTVYGEIDWGRRYKVMRRHTAGHLLDYCFSRVLGRPVRTLEVWMGDPCYTVYDGAEPKSSEVAEALEEASRLIAEDRRVDVLMLRWDEIVSKYPEAPNIYRVPRGLEVYRVVVIDGCNAIPCSGTHVKSLSELGCVSVDRVEDCREGFKVYYDVHP